MRRSRLQYTKPIRVHGGSSDARRGGTGYVPYLPGNSPERDVIDFSDPLRHREDRASFFCDVCKQQMTSKSLFIAHCNSLFHKEKEGTLKKLASENEWLCHSCAKPFPSKITLDQHCLMVRHEPLYRIEGLSTQPTESKKESEGRSEIEKADESGQEKKQVFSFRPLKPPYYCDICEVDCLNNAHLRAHQDSWRHRAAADKLKEDDPESNKVKDALTNSENDKVEGALNKNEKEVLSGPVGKQTDYYCDVCDVHITCHDNYIAHLNGKKHRASVSNIKHPYQCIFCDEEFSSTRSFNDHYKSAGHINKASRPVNRASKPMEGRGNEKKQRDREDEMRRERDRRKERERSGDREEGRRRSGERGRSRERRQEDRTESRSRNKSKDSGRQREQSPNDSDKGSRKRDGREKDAARKSTSSSRKRDRDRESSTESFEKKKAGREKRKSDKTKEESSSRKRRKRDRSNDSERSSSNSSSERSVSSKKKSKSKMSKKKKEKKESKKKYKRDQAKGSGDDDGNVAEEERQVEIKVDSDKDELGDLRAKLNRGKNIVITKKIKNGNEGNLKQEGTDTTVHDDDDLKKDEETILNHHKADLVLREQLLKEHTLEILKYKDAEDEYKRLCLEEDYLGRRLDLFRDGDPRKDSDVADLQRIQRAVREVREELEIRDVMIQEKERYLVVLKNRIEERTKIIAKAEFGSSSIQPTEHYDEEKLDKPLEKTADIEMSAEEDEEIPTSSSKVMKQEPSEDGDLRGEIERERILRKLAPGLIGLDPAIRQRIVDALISSEASRKEFLKTADDHGDKREAVAKAKYLQESTRQKRDSGDRNQDMKQVKQNMKGELYSKERSLYKSQSPEGMHYSEAASDMSRQFTDSVDEQFTVDFDKAADRDDLELMWKKKEKELRSREEELRKRELELLERERQRQSKSLKNNEDAADVEESSRASRGSLEGDRRRSREHSGDYIDMQKRGSEWEGLSVGSGRRNDYIDRDQQKRTTGKISEASQESRLVEGNENRDRGPPSQLPPDSSSPERKNNSKDDIIPVRAIIPTQGDASNITDKEPTNMPLQRFPVPPKSNVGSRRREQFALWKSVPPSGETERKVEDNSSEKVKEDIWDTAFGTGDTEADDKVAIDIFSDLDVDSDYLRGKLHRAISTPISKNKSRSSIEPKDITQRSQGDEIRQRGSPRSQFAAGKQAESRGDSAAESPAVKAKSFMDEEDMLYGGEQVEPVWKSFPPKKETKIEGSVPKQITQPPRGILKRGILKKPTDNFDEKASKKASTEGGDNAQMQGLSNRIGDAGKGKEDKDSKEESMDTEKRKIEPPGVISHEDLERVQMLIEGFKKQYGPNWDSSKIEADLKMVLERQQLSRPMERGSEEQTEQSTQQSAVKPMNVPRNETGQIPVSRPREESSTIGQKTLFPIRVSEKGSSTAQSKELPTIPTTGMMRVGTSPFQSSIRHSPVDLDVFRESMRNAPLNCGDSEGMEGMHQRFSRRSTDMPLPAELRNKIPEMNAENQAVAHRRMQSYNKRLGQTQTYPEQRRLEAQLIDDRVHPQRAGMVTGESRFEAGDFIEQRNVPRDVITRDFTEKRLSQRGPSDNQIASSQGRPNKRDFDQSSGDRYLQPFAERDDFEKKQLEVDYNRKDIIPGLADSWARDINERKRTPAETFANEIRVSGNRHTELKDPVTMNYEREERYPSEEANPSIKGQIWGRQSNMQQDIGQRPDFRAHYTEGTWQADLPESRVADLEGTTRRPAKPVDLPQYHQSNHPAEVRPSLDERFRYIHRTRPEDGARGMFYCAACQLYLPNENARSVHSNTEEHLMGTARYGDQQQFPRKEIPRSAASIRIQPPLDPAAVQRRQMQQHIQSGPMAMRQSRPQFISQSMHPRPHGSMGPRY